MKSGKLTNEGTVREDSMIFHRTELITLSTVTYAGRESSHPSMFLYIANSYNYLIGIKSKAIAVAIANNKNIY